jgi:hypothetical protein
VGQAYFYVKRQMLVDEFSIKLNIPNEIAFYILYGPRSSGKSSFVKTLPPPQGGILLIISAETIRPPPNDKMEEEGPNVFECLSRLLQCINLPQRYNIPTCKSAQEFQGIFSKKGGVLDCPVGLIIDEYVYLMENKEFNSMLRDMKHSHENYWVKVILLGYLMISSLLWLVYLN